MHVNSVPGAGTPATEATSM